MSRSVYRSSGVIKRVGGKIVRTFGECGCDCVTTLAGCEFCSTADKCTPGLMTGVVSGTSLSGCWPGFSLYLKFGPTNIDGTYAMTHQGRCEWKQTLSPPIITVYTDSGCTALATDWTAAYLDYYARYTITAGVGDPVASMFIGGTLRMHQISTGTNNDGTYELFSDGVETATPCAGATITNGGGLAGGTATVTPC